MKQYIFIAILVISGSSLTQAQRMLPGQKGLELNIGTLSDQELEKNYYLNLALTIYGKNGNYQLWALEYNHEYASYKDSKIPMETYIAEGGYSVRIGSDAARNITLNAALTAVFGYEVINRGNNLLYDGAVIRNKEGFVYGTGGRLSLETYLSDHFVLLIQGRAKMLWGTSREQFRPSAGIGFRFNF